MIQWWWLIPAVIVGEIVGIAAAAICSGCWDKMEEKAQKNRQRGNADGI